MAITQKMLWQIGFTTDTTKLRAELRDVQKEFAKIYNQPQKGTVIEDLSKDIVSASNAAKDLALYLQSAVNPKNGKLDVINFARTLEASGKSMSYYAEELSKLGPQGQQAFTKLAQSIVHAEQPTKRLTGLTNELWTTMKNTMRWNVTNNILDNFSQGISAAYSYAKDLNKSLNDIRIVSDESAADMARFAKEANKAAKALNSTTLDYTNASLIYYQQGLDSEQVKERTDLTIKMAQVSGDTVETVSDQLTAVWNNFYENGTQSLEHYADAMVALGAATASSSDEIAGGLQKFSSIADMIGLSFDYAASALATITATTRQSEDVVGTALRTILSRIQGLTLGETLEDGVNLNKYSKALAQVGINVLDTNGNLKAMDTILEELGAKWETISNAQQVALAQTVAGVRQYNQLVSLMDNWDFFQENLSIAQNSDGELTRQANIYAESWEAACNRVQTAWESLYKTVINDDFFISLANVAEKLLTLIDKLTSSLGGMSTILPTLGLAFSKAFSSKLTKEAANLQDIWFYKSKKGRQEYERIQQETSALVQSFAPSVDASPAEKLQYQYTQELFNIEDALKAKQQELSKEQLNQLEIQKASLEMEQTKTLELAKQEEMYYQQAQAKAKVLMYNPKNTKTSVKGGKEIQDNFDEMMKNPEFQNLVRKTISSKSAGTNFLKQNSSEVSLTKKNQEKWYAVYEATVKQKAEIEQLMFSFENKNIDNAQLTRVLNSTLFKDRYGGIEITDKNRSEMISELNASFADLERFGNYLSDFFTKTLKYDNEAFTDLTIDLGQASQSYTQLQFRTEQVNYSTNALLGNIKNMTNKFYQYSNAIINTANSAMTLVTFVSTLQGVFETIFDDTKSIEERFGEVVFGLGIAAAQLPEIIKLVKTLFSLITKGNPLAIIGVITGVVIGIDKLITKVRSGEIEIKKLSKINEKYTEQKETLENINSELDETLEKINELEDKDSLTLVEQEELNNLQQTVALLQQQKEIQEELTKQQKKSNIETIPKTAKKAEQKVLTPLQQSLASSKETVLMRYFGTTDYNSLTTEQKESLENFDKLRSRAEIISEWASENADKIEELDEAWDNYIDSLDEATEIDQEYVNRKTLRDMSYFSSEAEYGSKVISKALDIDEIENNADEIFKLIAAGETDLIDKIDLDTERALTKLGISTEAYVNYLNYLRNTAINNLNLNETEKSQFDELSKNFTAEDWEILASFSPEFLKQLTDVDKILVALDNKKYQIHIETNGADELLELYDKLTEERDVLKEALEEYVENGYLSNDTVKDLMDKGYNRYLIKVGNQWMLNNQALADYNENLSAQGDILDEQQKQYEKTRGVDYSFLDSPTVGALADEQRAALKEQGFIDEYEGSALEEFLIQMQSSGMYVGQTEKIVQGITLMSDAITQLDVAYQNGVISMDTYYAAMYDAQKAMGLLIQQKEEYSFIGIDEKTGEMFFNEDEDSWKNLTKEQQKEIENYKELYNKTIKMSEAYLSHLELVDKVADKYRKLNEETGEEHNYIINGKIDFESALENGIVTEQEIIKDAQDMILSSFDAVDWTNKSSIKRFYNLLSETFGEATATGIISGVNQAVDKDNFGEAKKIAKNKLANQTNEINLEQSEVAINVEGQNIEEQTTEELSNIYTVVGEFFQELADLVENFNLTLHFGLELDKINVQDIAQQALMEGKGFNGEIGQFTITGDKASNTVSNMRDVGSFLKENNSVLSSRGNGGFDLFNLSPYENGVLDVNKLSDLLGKKNGSTKDDTPQLKELEKFNDKYRDIENTLDRVEQQLDAIENANDRAFGFGKVKGYVAQIDKLKEKYAAYNEIAYQASVYRDREVAALNNLGMKVQLDENGIVDNTLEQLQWQALDEYNQVVKKYNSLNSKSAQEAMEDELNAAKDLYDQRKELLDELDSDISKFYDAVEEKNEALREIWDRELDIIKNRVETLLDAKDFNQIGKDMAQAFIESFGDELTQWQGRDKWQDILGVDRNSLSKIYDDNIDIQKKLITEYEQEYNDLMAKYANRKDGITDMEALTEEMKNLQDNLSDGLTSILETVEYYEELLPNAIDAARTRFNEFLDELGHNNTVLTSVKELLDLQGETYKTRKGYNSLQKITQQQMNSALTEAKLNKQANEKARKELEEAQAALEGVAETDLAYDMLKANRDALLAEYNQTQEDLLTAAQSAMEAAKDYYTTAIERASYEFEQAITSGLGFDLLQQKYDNLIEKEERYFDTVNEAYNAQTYYNKVQKAIDETSSAVAADRLKRLQTELELRQKNNTLNQYDLDVLEAKYNLTIAQNALEEAQNAKNQVRLVRNSAGNWDYQFTANQDDIDAAQDDYNKALNDWYNISKNQVKDIMDSILELKQDTHDQLEELYKDDTLTEAERNAAIEELRQNSLDKLTYLQREYQIAMDDMNEAGKLTITDYANTYQENIDLIDNSTQDFEQYFNEACDNMEEAFNNYNQTIGELAEDTGTDLSDLRDIIDEVTDSTEQCEIAGENAVDTMWNQIGKIQDTTDAFSAQADAIRDLIQQYMELANQNGASYNNIVNNSDKADLSGFDLADMGLYALANDPDKLQNISETRLIKSGEDITSQEQITAWQRDIANGKRSTLTKEQFEKLYADLAGIMGFDSGGYTGLFNDGKLAVLHEKELVLNQNDTSNMLAALNLLHSLAPSLVEMLKNKAELGSQLMSSRLAANVFSSLGSSKETTQKVEIKAEFPGVTSAAEIEEALNNIINDAAQFME